MTESKHAAVTANGRSYRWMDKPLVIICVDGCEADYITQAVEAGVAPYLKSMLEKGASLLGATLIPAWRRLAYR